MTPVDQLLQPISPEKPCGEDFSYHLSLQKLETLMRGKEETQFNAAEDPKWPDVRDQALDVLKQSKHLTPSVILTLALMQHEGISGLRDGLLLLRGLVEKYWDQLYPTLDDDPTERVNILNNLAALDKPFRFIPRFQEVKLPDKLGPVKVRDILIAKGKLPPPAGAPGLSEAQIQGMLRAAKPDALKAAYDSVTDSLQSLEQLEEFLATKVGSGQGPTLEEIKNNLQIIKTEIGNLVGVDSPTTIDKVTGAPSGPTPGHNGKIQSRADVLRVLGEVCEYYRQVEPASPVPFIIKRAQRMVEMNFIEIINELTPDSITQVKVITGPDPAEPPAA